MEHAWLLTFTLESASSERARSLDASTPQLKATGLSATTARRDRHGLVLSEELGKFAPP
jgi:hypothetical protein